MKRALIAVIVACAWPAQGATSAEEYRREGKASACERARSLDASSSDAYRNYVRSWLAEYGMTAEDCQAKPAQEESADLVTCRRFLELRSDSGEAWTKKVMTDFVQQKLLPMQCERMAEAADPGYMARLARQNAQANQPTEPQPSQESGSAWKWIAGAIAVAAGVAVARDIKRSGGSPIATFASGARTTSNSFPVFDYEWAWDEFFSEQWQLVWACRGKQTGQFADAEKCQYATKADVTWPSKTALGR